MIKPVKGSHTQLASPLSFEALFDPAFLARVDQFSLRIARVQAGGRLATQRTNARGQGTDFADFKGYVAGDDLRAIDWNIYQRLGRLFVRVFEERQDLPVYFLLDVSASMLVEAPPRAVAAARATLALAATALHQQDSVSLFQFSDKVATQLRGITGKANIIRVARSLAEASQSGQTSLAAAIEQIRMLNLRRGLLVIVSDFFDEAGIDDVKTSLMGVQQRMLLVQMTKPYDAEPALHPDLQGVVSLDGGEGGGVVEVAISEPLLTEYKKTYVAFNDALTTLAIQKNAGLLRLDCDVDILDQLSAFFLRGGLEQ